MRLMFTSMAAASHIGPTFPLARVFRELGHDVIYVTGPESVDYIKEAGFDALPGGALRRIFRERYNAEWAHELVGLTPEARLEHLVIYGLVAIASRAMAVDLVPIARSWDPDVIISNLAEWAGEIAATAVGASHVVHGFGPPKSATFGQRLEAALNDLYMENGLDGPTVEQRSAHPYLDIWPEQLRPSVAAWHYPNVWAMRPDHVLPGSATPRATSALAGLPYERTVYATAGTTYNAGASTMFQTIIDALRDEPVNVLVTVGPDGDPDTFNPLPAHIRVERYVPQYAVLPVSDAVICHGGAGTVLGALAHGVPVLMIPLASDHFEVAQQVVASGSGLQLPLQGLVVSDVRNASAELRSNPSYRLAANRLREEIWSMPEPAQVAARFVDLCPA